MYRTIPVKARFTDEEKAFWVNQCEHANSLINCAIYHTRQTHYNKLEQLEDAFTTYWRDDELRYGWKTYKCNTTYPELDKALKDSPHYKAMAAQAAQQTLKTVGESITSYNGLVNAYYKGNQFGERKRGRVSTNSLVDPTINHGASNPPSFSKPCLGEVDKPSLPRYRKRGGLAAVTFPRQALNYKNGCFYPSISRDTKPHLLTQIKLHLPEFIDSDWVKEVTVRPSLGLFVVDWVIDDGKEPIKVNPNLDYTQAWSFDHGGTNWLTGVSTRGKSLIIDGRKLKAMNQGYCRLVANYKQGKSDFYWDSNLDRVQRKRNNQMRDAVNKAARFIINQCLNDRVGNLVIGWNEGQKNGSNMGKRGNQNFVVIPTGRLIERLKQICPEYGIQLTITEEAYTSKASYLDGDSLYKHGEKPDCWKPSGTRVKRGLYKSRDGHLINADCNGSVNIMKKVATQLGLNLVEVGRASLTVPQRIDLFTRLNKSYRKRCVARILSGVAASL